MAATPPQALVTLLTSLSASVIPESACPTVLQALEGVDARTGARTVLSKLPSLHRAVFAYLVR